MSVTFTSNNKVRGTNLFGFQTNIQEHDSISGYFDMIYQAQTLSYKNTETWTNPNNKKITAFRFGLDNSQRYNVTVEELTNKVI